MQFNDDGNVDDAEENNPHSLSGSKVEMQDYSL